MRRWVMIVGMAVAGAAWAEPMKEVIYVPKERFTAYMIEPPGADLVLDLEPAEGYRIMWHDIRCQDWADIVQWTKDGTRANSYKLFVPGDIPGVPLMKKSSREWLAVTGGWERVTGGKTAGKGEKVDEGLFEADVLAVDLDFVNVKRADDPDDPGDPDLTDETREETVGALVGLTGPLTPLIIREIECKDIPEPLLRRMPVVLTQETARLVKVWDNPDRTGTPLTLPHTNYQANLPVTVHVEPLEASEAPRDLVFKVGCRFQKLADAQGRTKRWVEAIDRVAITVLKVDIDADTDNDGNIDADDSGEDQFEEYAPGRILCVNGFGINTNTDYLAEIKLAIQPTLTTGTAKLEALDGGSRIKVWTTTNKTTEVTLPKAYDLTTTNPPSSLYVDGIATGKVQLAFSYTAGSGGFTCTDQVAMLIIPTISYAPGKGTNAFVWSSLKTGTNSNSGNNLGWADATEFENQIKEQGWPTVTWLEDTTGDTDTNFGSCTLANYKGMTNCGIFTIVSHGEEGRHPAVYAEYSAAGWAAISNWCAGETGITIDPWIPIPTEPAWTAGCYVARVSSSWLSANWKPAMDTTRAISFWSICYSATSNTVSGEDAVKECAGGRWRVGYIDPTTETEAKDTNERLLKRMNGSTDSARKRTAGEAYESGSGYSANAKMDGNDWTTLCPAPLADNAVFPDTMAGNRKGWGCIIFDTYMSTTNAASDALTKQSGCPTSAHRWFGNTDGTYGLGFDFDKTGGVATTMRAVADKCRNDGLGGGRKLDGNRVKPNNDNRDWSF